MTESRDSDHQIKALFEAAPNGVAALTPCGTMRVVNAAFAQMFGYEATALHGLPAAMLIAPDDQADYASVLAEVADDASARGRREFSGLRLDGSEFPLQAVLTSFVSDGEPRLLLLVSDATERRKSEDRQNLLIGELHHRTQNLFAVIQSVATRSLAGERSLDEAKRIFLNRLHALSRTYTMLTETAWQGAMLEQIVRDELAGFSDRVAVDGNPIVIQPSAAQTFAMIFHELATNALKYGALSAREGHLSVRWSLQAGEDGDTFLLRWEEHGGPSVQNFGRKGFGHTILDEGARHIGQPSIIHTPLGLRYELVAPLSAIGWRADDLAPRRDFSVRRRFDDDARRSN